MLDLAEGYSAFYEASHTELNSFHGSAYLSRDAFVEVSFDGGCGDEAYLSPEVELDFDRA